MLGSNRLNMCAIEMKSAIEYYLNEHVFTADHRVIVKAVSQNSDGHHTNFEITLESPVEKEVN